MKNFVYLFCCLWAVKALIGVSTGSNRAAACRRRNRLRVYRTALRVTTDPKKLENSGSSDPISGSSTNRNSNGVGHSYSNSNKSKSSEISPSLTSNSTNSIVNSKESIITASSTDEEAFYSYNLDLISELKDTTTPSVIFSDAFDPYNRPNAPRFSGRKGYRNRRSRSDGSDNAIDKNGRPFEDQRYKPEFFSVELSFDYLASNSLAAIEVLPFIRKKKTDWYLARWWNSALKWGLLSDELVSKLYHEVCSEEGPSKDYFIENYSSRNISSVQPISIEKNNTEIVIPLDFSKSDVGSRTKVFRSGVHKVYIPKGTNGNTAGKVQFMSSSKDDEENGHNQENLQHNTPSSSLKALSDGHFARVICVGDVHGCVDELIDLLKKVSYTPGDVVLFLGDLVGKGPNSTAVIQLAMDIHAITVRGNHDQEVIRQGISFHKRSGRYSSSQSRESAMKRNEHLKIALSLSNVEFSWLCKQPYYIQSTDLGALFVHAGFHANYDLEHQRPWAMMTMRSVLPNGKISPRCVLNQSWGSTWKGPRTVYFGHDAARGFQNYEYAVGIDTGLFFHLMFHGIAVSVYHL